MGWKKPLSLAFKTSVACAALIVAAGYGGALAGDDAGAPLQGGTPAEGHVHAASWGYEGGEGPEHWGEVSALCGLGKLQSPVDLKPTMQAGLSFLKTSYASAPLTVINNGHTIQVNYPEGSTMTADGETFQLVQFHFHTPSEYTVRGKRYDMEAHFVHKDSKGKLGVVGILIEEGAENPAAAQIWKHLSATARDPKTFPEVSINAADFFPKNMSHYQLTGSLTTPPCSEGVSWYVLTTPIQFSAKQIAAFKNFFPMNARPVQQTNGRPIVLEY